MGEFVALRYWLSAEQGQVGKVSDEGKLIEEQGGQGCLPTLGICGCQTDKSGRRLATQANAVFNEVIIFETNKGNASKIVQEVGGRPSPAIPRQVSHRGIPYKVYACSVSGGHNFLDKVGIPEFKLASVAFVLCLF